jgi:hypothetical protein
VTLRRRSYATPVDPGCARAGCRSHARRRSTPPSRVGDRRAPRIRPHPRARTQPGKEVERLTEVPAVVQPAGDRRKVVETGRHVAGALLEDPAALVLRQLPPSVCLRDGDERGASGALAAKRFLLGYQRVVLASRDITLVARHAAQDPHRAPTEGARCSALDHFKPGHWLQRRSNHRLKALDRPRSIVSTSKGHQERTHVKPVYGRWPIRPEPRRILARSAAPGTRSKWSTMPRAGRCPDAGRTAPACPVTASRSIKRLSNPMVSTVKLRVRQTA